MSIILALIKLSGIFGKYAYINKVNDKRYLYNKNMYELILDYLANIIWNFYFQQIKKIEKKISVFFFNNLLFTLMLIIFNLKL
jgi:hypothetical protein